MNQTRSQREEEIRKIERDQAVFGEAYWKEFEDGSIQHLPIATVTSALDPGAADATFLTKEDQTMKSKKSASKKKPVKKSSKKSK